MPLLEDYGIEHKQLLGWKRNFEETPGVFTLSDDWGGRGGEE